MKTLKKILIWIIVIIALIVLVSFLLPGKYTVEKSVVINADKEIIFDQICDFNNWDNWTPWGVDVDSTVKYVVTGCCEVGAMQSWTGEKIGIGEMTITGLQPYSRIDYKVAFDGGKYSSTGYYQIDPQDEGFLVTWVDEGELGYNPIYRYLGLFMDKFLGTNMESGLQNLKKVAEGLPSYPDIEVVVTESTPSIAIIDSCTVDELGMKMGEMFMELMDFVKLKKLEVNGYPYALYYKWNPQGYTVIETGIPVVKIKFAKGKIFATESPGGKVVKAIYFGPYEEIGVAHEAIEKYVKLNGLEIIGPPWDEYITDPQTEPDPNKWETHVLYPVK